MTYDEWKTSPPQEPPELCPRCDMAPEDCECDWPEDDYDTLEEAEMDR